MRESESSVSNEGRRRMQEVFTLMMTSAFSDINSNYQLGVMLNFGVFQYSAVNGTNVKTAS